MRSIGPMRKHLETIQFHKLLNQVVHGGFLSGFESFNERWIDSTPTGFTEVRHDFFL